MAQIFLLRLIQEQIIRITNRQDKYHMCLDPLHEGEGIQKFIAVAKKKKIRFTHTGSERFSSIDFRREMKNTFLCTINPIFCCHWTMSIQFKEKSALQKNVKVAYVYVCLLIYQHFVNNAQDGEIVSLIICDM